MAEITLDAIADELRAMRLELRRIAENQRYMAQAVNNLHDQMNSLRDDLVLTVRTEIGGLFGHLETRLEHRIDDVLRERS